MKFFKGESVTIHHLGQLYPSYETMAELMQCGDEFRRGFGAPCSDEDMLRGITGIIVDIQKHPQSPNQSIVGVRVPIKHDKAETTIVLINEMGIRSNIELGDELFEI